MGASSSGSLLKLFQKDVVKEELHRGSASCHASHVGVAMRLCRAESLLVATTIPSWWWDGWCPQGADQGWEMDSQGHISTLDPDMSLSYKSPILQLPAGPYPFSAPCQPHMPQMRAQRWISHLHSDVFVPSWNQMSSQNPRLMTLALLGGKWPQICPLGREIR